MLALLLMRSHVFLYNLFSGDGDEEFSANANILFDKHIAQFIHPESVSVLANVGVSILMSNS
jgi:hypothetical protein